MKRMRETEEVRVMKNEIRMRTISAAILLMLLAFSTEMRAQAEAERSESAAAATAVRDSFDISDYFVLGESEEMLWKYRFGTSPAGFIDQFTDYRERFLGEIWFVRVRTYSTGATDTILYRRAEDGVYHIRPGMMMAKPSMTLPTIGWVGRRWFEHDKTWSYTITSLSATLESETMDYGDLLVVRSEEQYPAEGKKARVYDLYFARGIGMVATVVTVEAMNAAGVLEEASIAIVRLVEAEGLDQG